MGTQETKSSIRDEKRIAEWCVLDGSETLIGGRRYIVSKVSGLFTRRGGGHSTQSRLRGPHGDDRQPSERHLHSSKIPVGGRQCVALKVRGLDVKLLVLSSKVERRPDLGCGTSKYGVKGRPGLFEGVEGGVGSEAVQDGHGGRGEVL